MRIFSECVPAKPNPYPNDERCTSIWKKNAIAIGLDWNNIFVRWRRPVGWTHIGMDLCPTVNSPGIVFQMVPKSTRSFTRMSYLRNGWLELFRAKKVSVALFYCFESPFHSSISSFSPFMKHYFALFIAKPGVHLRFLIFWANITLFRGKPAFFAIFARTAP